MGDPRDDRSVSVHDVDAGVDALVYLSAQLPRRSLEHLQVREGADGQHGRV